MNNFEPSSSSNFEICCDRDGWAKPSILEALVFEIILLRTFQNIGIDQSCLGKRLLNDWRHSWCTYDAFVGVRMTSLPVYRKTFGYLSLSDSTHGSGFPCLILEISSTHGSDKTQHNPNSTQGSYL